MNTDDNELIMSKLLAITQLKPTKVVKTIRETRDGFVPWKSTVTYSQGWFKTMEFVLTISQSELDGSDEVYDLSGIYVHNWGSEYNVPVVQSDDLRIIESRLREFIHMDNYQRLKEANAAIDARHQEMINVLKKFD